MGLLTGRDTIALTDGSVEVELNVSTDLSHSYPSQVTQYTVEKSIGKTSINDHVIPGQITISLNCIISSSVSLFALSYMDFDEKMKHLIQWQKDGALLTLLGYDTGGLIKEILKLLPSSFRFITPDDPDQRYIGRSFDEIPNLVLGDVNFIESAPTGKDAGVSLLIVPVVIAEAKTRNFVAQSGKVPTKKVTKSGSAASAGSGAKSIIKGVFG